METRLHIVAIGILLIGLLVQVNFVSAQTWIAQSGPQRGNVSVQDLAVGRAPADPAATGYFVDGANFYRSLDGGATWNSVCCTSMPLAVTCKPSTPIYVVKAEGNGSGWYSTNSGTDWRQATGTVGGLTPTRLATSPVTDANMLLGEQKCYGEPSLFRSTNSGVSWGSVTDFVTTYITSITALMWHPTNGQIALAGGTANAEDCTGGGGGPNGPQFLDPPVNGVFVSTNAGQNWNKSANIAQDINALTCYPVGTATYAFAATAGGTLYKCTNATNTGASWIAISFPGGIINDLRAVLVGSSYTIYATSATGVYKSTDNGASWSSLCAGMIDKTNMTRVGIDPQNSNVVIAGSTTNLYRSADAGATWTEVAPQFGSISCAAIGACSPTILIAPTSFSVIGRYNGSAWLLVELTPCLDDFRGKMVGFQTSAGTVAFLAGYRTLAGSGDTKASIWRSTDGGSPGSWTEAYSGNYYGAGYRFNGFSVDPINSQRIHVWGLRRNNASGYNDNHSISLDGGVNWAQVPVPDNTIASVPEISDFAYDKTNAYADRCRYLFASVYTGTSSEKGIWKTSNGTLPFTRLTHSLVYQQPVRVLGNNTNVLGVLYAAGGTTGAYWIRKTIDLGTNWSSLPWTATEDISRIVMHPGYPNSADNFYVVAASGTKVYRTTNGGSSWINVTGSVPIPISDLRQDINNATGIYATTSGGIYKLSFIPAPPSGLYTSTFCPGGGGGGLSPDGTDPNCYPVLHWNLNSEPDMGFSPAQYIIERSIGSPNNFVPITSRAFNVTSFTDYGASQTQMNYYRMKAVDAAGNVSDYSSYVAWPYTKVSAPPSNGLDRGTPVKFALAQNHPNPFNPTTMFQYALAADERVVLKIFDVLGRDVATVVDEFQSAGYKSVEFDASHLPSGIYFYRLTAGKFTDVKKMLLMR